MTVRTTCAKAWGGQEHEVMRDDIIPDSIEPYKETSNGGKDMRHLTFVSKGIAGQEG